MTRFKSPHSMLYKILGFGVMVTLALVLLAPQVHFLRSTIDTIIHADHIFFIWAFLAIATTYLTAALSYYILAPQTIYFWRTVLVQVADGFANRLFPASLGGIATNFLYLIKQHHTKSEASFVVAANNILGFIGHSLLLSILLVAGYTNGLHLFNSHLAIRLALAAGIIAVIASFYLVFVSKVQASVVKTTKMVADVIRYSFSRPVQLFNALLSSIMTTIGYSATLYFSLLAVNVHISLLQTFVVLTASVLFITITPTPGGIGGAEAGLTGALLGMSVPTQQALSAVLLYRFMTFWLPILPGFLALQTAFKRRYVQLVKFS